MTKLMEQVIAQLKSLPEARQDEVAGIVMNELLEDGQWSETTRAYESRLGQVVDQVLSGDASRLEKLDPDSL